MRYVAIPALCVLTIAFTAPAAALMGLERPPRNLPRANPPYATGVERAPNDLPRRSHSITFETPRPSTYSTDRDVRDMRKWIKSARASGIISKSEARQLKREARLIGSIANRYRQDSLSELEKTELDNRSLYLRSRLGRPR